MRWDISVSFWSLPSMYRHLLQQMGCFHLYLKPRLVPPILNCESHKSLVSFFLLPVTGCWPKERPGPQVVPPANWSPSWCGDWASTWFALPQLEGDNEERESRSLEQKTLFDYLAELRWTHLNWTELSLTIITVTQLNSSKLSWNQLTFAELSWNQINSV